MTTKCKHPRSAVRDMPDSARSSSNCLILDHQMRGFCKPWTHGVMISEECTLCGMWRDVNAAGRTPNMRENGPWMEPIK